ncbi:class I SAM-dependent rRNA methyltransferase [bacterium]|nr:class I SAM-dependent rRNA methyltransferase [bacterium]
MVDVLLHPGRDRSVRRRHPWVFSGAVARVEGAGEAGAWARVLSSEGELLGFGHLSPHSNLRVRMLVFGEGAPGAGLIGERIARAVSRRVENPLLGDADAVRLVNAEGDWLPGLVADRYGDVVVAKLTSAGMEARREEIARALESATGAAVGFERADPAAARREGVPARQGALWGRAPEGPVAIRERERRYRVDVVGGQKTGFYIDQRDARDLVQSVAEGRRVLDLFSYTGGFAVAAARGGAESATLVESSSVALDLARENLDGNAPGAAARFVRGDAFRFVRREEELFDLVIIDPPPLARHRRDVPRACRAYKDVLLFGMRRTAPGGLLLGFACSHHVGPELLRKVAFGAALDAGCAVQMARTLGATVDHPVSVDHPEGAYLNGLLLQL